MFLYYSSFIAYGVSLLEYIMVIGLSVVQFKWLKKIERPRSASPICLIVSIITDRIGRQKVLLPINRNYNNICNTLGFFVIKSKEIPKVFFFFFANSEKSHFSARAMARTVLLLSLQFRKFQPRCCHKIYFYKEKRSVSVKHSACRKRLQSLLLIYYTYSTVILKVLLVLP